MEAGTHTNKFSSQPESALIKFCAHVNMVYNAKHMA